MTSDVILVGTGQMAKAHAAVLAALDVGFTAVSRGEASATRFTEETGHPAVAGGLEARIRAHGAPARAVVAVPIVDLAATTRLLVDAGCKEILLEKPAAVDAAGIFALARHVATTSARVTVAYNRRYYDSVTTARARIAEDGGAQSLFFEFTEVGDRVGVLPYDPAVLANWELANSTHVFDTAFFLAGRPAEIEGSISGGLPWHPRGSRWVGHGRTESGADFAYFADWDAPGRWGIEVNTRANRYVLRPMETLQVQKRGTFSLEPVPLDDDLDRRFKPGLYRQTEAWLAGGDDRSIDLGRYASNIRLLSVAILGEPLSKVG